MALSRRQRMHISQMDAKERNRRKPLARKVVHQWLAPIRKALVELGSGYVTEVDGRPVTAIAWANNENAPIDECINGFVAMVNRISSAFDTGPLSLIAGRLTEGELLTNEDIAAGFKCLKGCEDLIITRPRSEIYAASVDEQLAIIAQNSVITEE